MQENCLLLIFFPSFHFLLGFSLVAVSVSISINLFRAYAHSFIIPSMLVHRVCTHLWAHTSEKLEHRWVHLPSITVKQLSYRCSGHFGQDYSCLWQISRVVSDKCVLTPIGNPFLRLNQNILQIPHPCPKACQGKFPGWGRSEGRTWPSIPTPPSQNVTSLSSTSWLFCTVFLEGKWALTCSFF